MLPKAIIGPECRERFLPLDTLPGLRPLGVSLAGVSDLRGSYEMRRPAPDHHVILATVAGAGLYSLEEPRPVDPGDLLLMPAGQAHAYRLGAGHWQIVWCHLADSPEWSALHTLSPQDYLRPGRSADVDRLERLFFLALDSAGQTDETDPIARLITLALRRIVAPDVADSRDRHRRLDRVFARAQTQLQVPWTVAQLASRYGASPAQFTRDCRAIYGQSPARRLRQIRLERARDLVVHSDLPLAAIAHRVAYATPFALSAAYAQQFGRPPASDRRA